MRPSGTGAPALAGGAVAGQGNSSVRGGAAGRRAPAIGEAVGQQLEAEGWRSLKKAGRAGRRPRLSAEDLKKIQRGLKRGPEALGYETGLWTAWRVAHLIEEECRVRYHTSQAWRILRQLGWSCRRPEGRALER